MCIAKRAAARDGLLVGLAYREAAGFAVRASEQRQLLSGPFDEWVEAEIRLEVGQVERIAGQEGSQVTGFDDVPRPLVEGRAKQGRALQLVAHELGSLRRHHPEPGHRWVRRD